MSPELDDLQLPVEAGLDDVLQHLVLTALTDDMEQSMISRNIKTFSFSIKVYKQYVLREEKTARSYYTYMNPNKNIT